MTNIKPKVFYSFHFDNDVFRTQMVRNIGAIERSEPVKKNVWENVRRTPGGIEHWINESMNNKDYVVVLIGSDTHTRPWVQYEISKGWNEKKKLIGIYIHNLRDMRFIASPPYYGKCRQGINPFTRIALKNGATLDRYVPCFDPNPADAYNSIANNILGWIKQAKGINDFSW